MDIRVLGPVEVWIADEPVSLGGQKQRALFGLLAAAVPHRLAAEVLLQGIWGEDVAGSAKATLQTYVWNLRQVLGEVLVHDRGGYRLEVEPEAVDAVRFQDALESARTEVATDPAGTAARLRRALGWWRGLPYADLVGIPGLEAEMRRLEQLRLEAVELRIDAELALGHHGEQVTELEALADEHPTRERFRAQHMLALYRSGRQAEALRAYRRTESYLAEQVGLEPSQELQDLELRILEQDDSLLSGTGRAVNQRLAFLVTDIQGSTRLWDRFPQAMAEALATHDRLMAEAVEGAEGRVFKHTGDGILAVFPTASGAVTAAEAALRSLDLTEWGEVGEIRVRMGIDAGEVEARDDDFFGPPLNRAARLCSVAHGGQVLVSAGAQAEVAASAPPGLQIRHLGEAYLRGMAAPERIAQLVFVGLPADFPELRTHDAAPLDDRAPVVSLPGYELREQIGEGAFGVVWRAYQPSVGREVAIKVIRPELASHPSFVRRFEAEARTIARLGHPHIVPLIDFWRDTDRAYLVLGLLQGGSLEQALRGGGVDQIAGRRILEQLGSALDHAHSLGLTHGDLKPANVLLDGAGNAYLSDFGIASRLVDPEVATPASSPHRYRAPEETDTGPSDEADRFALGMIAGELLNGDGELEPVLARATAPNPADRYPSAGAFLAELEQALGEDTNRIASPVVSRNPYKGLRPFDEADTADFYGRDDLVAALVTAVAHHRFVTVIGPSGSGKSSVVRAGLLPALTSGAVAGSDHWFTHVLTPGPSPVASLAGALGRLFGRDVDPAQVAAADLNRMVEGEAADGELLVVVDQFEEIYTLVEDLAERRRFTDLLAEMVQSEGSRVRVVATLRADLYDRPLADERLGPLVKEGQVTVLPPSREDHVEMVTAPAQAVGLRWEPGLAHRIAEDVAHQSGGLPLLQYALTELVERRSGDLLTGSDYTRIGKVAGALAGRAETIYQSLSPSQQEAARQILLRLLTVDEATDDTRRRVRRSELESLRIARADLQAVLDRFVTERLLLADRDPVTRGPSIEVAHEALLREWPRLAGWIDDQREALILSRRFRAALADWEANGKHADYLLTGHRLAPYTGWVETAALTTEEQDFYQVSRTKDDQDRTARGRRRRTITGILAGATILAALLGIVAVLQAGRATTERDRALAAEADAETQAERAEAAAAEAESAAQLARSRELAASAINALSDDPSLAKLLALSAAQIADPPLEVVSVLHRAFAADPVIARYSLPDGSRWTDLHPRGKLLLASGATPFESAGQLQVVDVESGEVLWSYQAEHEAISLGPAYFSPDGERVVAGAYWEPIEEAPAAEGFRSSLGVHIWEVETGKLMDRFNLGRCGGIVVDVSQEHVLVRTRPDHIDDCWALPNPFDSPAFEVSIEMVEIASGNRELLSPSAALLFDNIASLSDDGRYVGFENMANDPPTAAVLDLETGERVMEYDPLSTGAANPALRALNRDGSFLLEGARPTQVWDVARGEVIASFDIGLSPFAVFGPSGRTVYATERDGTLRQWDARTGEEMWRVPGVGGGRVSISSDGRILVTDPEAGEAVLVDTRLRGEAGAVETCQGGWLPVAAHSLNTAGGLAVFSGACTDASQPLTAHIIDLEGPELLSTLPEVEGQVIRLSPDGSLLATQDASGGLAGPVVVRDPRTGEEMLELEGLCRWDQQLTTLSAVPREEAGDCRPYPDPPFPIWIRELEWSPDQTMIAAVDDWAGETYLAVWNAETGRLLFSREPGGFIAFTPDSEALMTAPYGQPKLEMISTDTWEVLHEVSYDSALEGGESLGLAGYSRDGSMLVAVGGFAGGGGGALHWFDSQTLEHTQSRTRIHEGSPKSLALSPDASLLATGASDGFVRVWESETGTLAHEIPIGDTEVQGVAFVDDRHLVVTPGEGNLIIFTIDTDELVDIVGSSLTRGFTETECERFNFGDDCPTLEELRDG